MRIEPEKLHEEMLASISEKVNQPNKTDMVESCFWIACKYWGILKKEIDQSFFEYREKEINFFRNIKPRFTSQVQYYSMLAEVLLFVPDDIEIQIEYWKNEQKRCRRFCEKNEEFVVYYETNCVHMDSVYFVRVSKEWVPSFQPVSYDADKNFCSSHDHLVRGLLAHRMYQAFVQEKLSLVKNEL